MSLQVRDGALGLLSFGGALSVKRARLFPGLALGAFLGVLEPSSPVRNP